jgi:hemoglobin
MKRDTLDHEGIIELVDTFYRYIRTSETLGEIFETHIGTEDHEWKNHLTTMYSFWSSVMLRSGTYRGNPMQTHVQLGYFPPELFDEWLSLFKSVCDSIFIDSISKEFYNRAVMIATTLKARLYPDISMRQNETE